MKPIQWLLIGGPRHGTTVWIKAGWSVVLPDGTIYSGMNWIYDGRVYRVGYTCPGGADDVIAPEHSVVNELIHKLKPEPVAGS